MTSSEEAFARQFNMTRNLTQFVGCGYDFTCMHTGKRYELKEDRAAAKTGNVFIELRQTFDNGHVWSDSGFNLSRKQADVFVIKLGSQYVFLDIDSAERVVRGVDTQPRMTREGKNGNSPGRFSLGVLVPVARWLESAYEITQEEPGK